MASEQQKERRRQHIEAYLEAYRKFFRRGDIQETLYKRRPSNTDIYRDANLSDLTDIVTDFLYPDEPVYLLDIGPENLSNFIFAIHPDGSTQRLGGYSTLPAGAHVHIYGSHASEFFEPPFIPCLHLREANVSIDPIGMPFRVLKKLIRTDLLHESCHVHLLSGCSEREKQELRALRQPPKFRDTVLGAVMLGVREAHRLAIGGALIYVAVFSAMLYLVSRFEDPLWAVPLSVLNAFFILQPLRWVYNHGIDILNERDIRALPPDASNAHRIAYIGEKWPPITGVWSVCKMMCRYGFGIQKRYRIPSEPQIVQAAALPPVSNADISDQKGEGHLLTPLLVASYPSNEEEVGYGGMFAQRRGSGEVGIDVLPPDVVIENSGAAAEYHRLG